MTNLPDDNPKTARGLKKASVQFVPATARLYLGEVMKSGAVKYGPFNWRQDRITASTYYDAASRHMEAWFCGEDLDPESGQPHLAHAMACFAIVLDAREHGCLNDDRPASPQTLLLMKRLGAKPADDPCLICGGSGIETYAAVPGRGCVETPCSRCNPAPPSDDT